jgi:hypothetical protein
VDDAILPLADILNRTGLPYALIGGHAVNAWLAPRFTADVDVTIQASATDLAHLEAALAAEGYTLESRHGTDLPSGPDFLRFVHPGGPVALEVQTAKTDFQREVVRRAAAPGGAVCVATPEDLIVMKLIADRPKDRTDLAGLVQLPALDWDYVERWAAAWGVLEALGRVRGER